jgi:prepilin-type N-terminal cleavage/methylation domain-containing protein
MKKDTQHSTGFTLLEMAIVIVVVSLLIGGVLIGQGMIRTAELNGVITTTTKYKDAIDSFKSKYTQFPGDISDAFNFWDNGAGTICGTAAQCNGDGNGVLDRVSANENEKLRAWQHLQLANMTSLNLIGYESTANDEAINTNVANSTIEGAGFRFDTVSSVNLLELAADSGNPGLLQAGALKAEDAASIDKKVDDGAANTGFVISVNGAANIGCVINPGVNDGYDLDNVNVACRIRFKFLD